MKKFGDTNLQYQYWKDNQSDISVESYCVFTCTITIWISQISFVIYYIYKKGLSILDIKLFWATKLLIAFIIKRFINAFLKAFTYSILKILNHEKYVGKGRFAG